MFNPRRVLKDLVKGLKVHPWPDASYDPLAIEKTKFLLILGAAPYATPPIYNEDALVMYRTVIFL